MAAAFLLLSSHDLLPVPVASRGSFGIRGMPVGNMILFERGNSTMNECEEMRKRRYFQELARNLQY